jgi:hypothetical protein
MDDFIIGVWMTMSGCVEKNLEILDRDASNFEFRRPPWFSLRPAQRLQLQQLQRSCR